MIGRDGVCVTEIARKRHERTPSELYQGFESVEGDRAVEYRRAGHVVKKFKIWRCRNFTGWDPSKPVPEEKAALE